MVVILSAIGHAIPSAGYVFTVAALVYGSAIIFGVPAFLLSRRWHLDSTAFYLGVAVVVATPPIAATAILTRGVVLPLVVGLSAAAGGIVFHEVMERRPTETRDLAKSRIS